MEPNEDRLLKLILKARYELFRKDFASFIAQCFITLNPGVSYLPNWHIDVIAEHLEACRRGELTRLLINMPPRMLKSISVSVAWPAYLLGLEPTSRVMAASYAAALSVKHSVDCRKVMLSPWYQQVFPHTRLSRDQNEKRKFLTTAHGHRIATSVGGVATGEGGSFLIVDDPQSPMQIISERKRQMAIQWFDNTFTSRLDDKRHGVMVVVMQRLHAQDLSGYLLEKGGWEHLCLPAIAKEQSYYDFGGGVRKWREVGEILHPAREDEALLDVLRHELGSYVFEAQYQQNPVPMDGGIIRREWLRRFHSTPETIERIVQSWDTAIKAAKENDASVCLTFGEAEGVHYLLDVQVLRLEYPALRRKILQLAEDWQADAVLMEDKASGQSLIQDLKGEMNIPLIAIYPRGDKVSRMAQASVMVEAGRFSLPTGASWLAEFERELLAFPNAAHDDQVDALSQYLNWVRYRSDRIRPTIRGL